MPRLWEKGYELDRLVEEFTVGSDFLLDRELLVADCAGSVAHLRMLGKIGILTPTECRDLESELRSIARLAADGEFEIRREDEDCHSAIENHLTARIGEAGKKIHTGRSRNDQVSTALRLLERSYLIEFSSSLLELLRSLTEFARRERLTPMPGRTHLQIAMPSSVGLWLMGFAEQLADQLVVADAVYSLIDRSPLGSSAGYGVPLPIDREYSAEAMGFSGVQNNVVAVAAGRGEIEAWLLSVIEHVCLVLSRFAQDLILFSLPEIGYFSMHDSMTTGSSLMPQKKNPDILELMRARSSTVSSCTSQVTSILRSLPSGYNRDLQETKEPTLKGMRIGLQTVRIARLALDNVVVHPDRLEAGFRPEIFATDAALELVANGVSFRDAYRTIADDLTMLEKRDPAESLHKRAHTGTPAHLGIEAFESRLDSEDHTLARRSERVRSALLDLLGSDIPIYSPLLRA